MKKFLIFAVFVSLFQIQFCGEPLLNESDNESDVVEQELKRQSLYSCGYSLLALPAFVCVLWGMDKNSGFLFGLGFYQLMVSYVEFCRLIALCDMEKMIKKNKSRYIQADNKVGKLESL